jgi:hypothetical protein
MTKCVNRPHAQEETKANNGAQQNRKFSYKEEGKKFKTVILIQNGPRGCDGFP